ncbi:hypothetical protein SAMN05444161_5568 [Rhizobiales bacterium GAS191]|nr:hypothetical protein SAMN05444161_5568 [Rhizobiales bacterium GAS191]
MVEILVTDAIAPRRQYRRGYTRSALPETCRLDRRTRRSRRYEYLLKSFTPSNSSLAEADKAQIALAASLTVAVEEMQFKLLAGESVDAEQAIRLANSQRRALLAVAEIGRRAVTPKSYRETLIEQQNAALSQERAAEKAQRDAHAARQRRYRARLAAKAAETQP